MDDRGDCRKQKNCAEQVQKVVVMVHFAGIDDRFLTRMKAGV
jgi:hypothetical protein